MVENTKSGNNFPKEDEEGGEEKKEDMKKDHNENVIMRIKDVGRAPKNLLSPHHMMVNIILPMTKFIILIKIMIFIILSNNSFLT